MTLRTVVAFGLLAGLVANHASFATEAQSGSHFFTTEPVFNSRVYIERWGNPANPPVVLVHGLGDNGARDWQNLAPKLAENYYVLTFDLPGFGRSGKSNELYSPGKYTHFVRWITAAYIDRPFTLIGHSMGGAIALNYAATYPDGLARLILIDAAGVLHRVAFSTHLFDELKPTWWWDVFPATNTEKLRALIGVDIVALERYPLPIDELLRTPVIRQVFLGSEPSKIAALALVQHDFSGLLESVSAPTLIIWGDRDAVTPLRTGKLLAARIREARLEIIAGAGHMPMLQKPSELNRLILEELAGQPAEPRRNGATAGNQGSTESTVAAANPDRTGECVGENDKFFTGRYAVITIVQCKRVRIENADIDFLDILGSSVELTNSRIGHAQKALQIDRSTLVATATEFSAEVPIITTDSRLDLAGTKITAGTRPIEATGTSTALFSISELQSQGRSRRLHGVFWLSESQALQ